jgi:hypothetical protein
MRIWWKFRNPWPSGDDDKSVDFYSFMLLQYFCFPLQEAWLKRMDDPPLKEHLSLTWQETLTHQGVAVSFPITPADMSSFSTRDNSVENHLHSVDVYIPGNIQGISSGNIPKKGLENLEQSVAQSLEEKVEADLQQTSQTHIPIIPQPYKNPSIDLTTVSVTHPDHEQILLRSEYVFSDDQNKLKSCQGPCSDINDTEKSSPSNIGGCSKDGGVFTGFIQFDAKRHPPHTKGHCCAIIKNLEDYVQDLAGEFGDMYPEVFKYLFLVIKLISCDLDNILAKTDSFPYSLIEEYVELCKDDKNHEEFQNEFHISPEKNIVLTIFSGWLGEQNASLQDSINQKAECFKLAHINCIDNLPPSEDIIEEVFPPHMKVLFSQWMTAGEREAHHAGGKKPRLMKDTRGIFPFILLILEFANGAFISGVSHVIHAKLVHVT